MVGRRITRITKRGHRLGEIAQSLLLHHLRADRQPRMLRPGLGKLSALLKVTRRARATRAPVTVLLHGEVPHVPGMRAMVPQHRLLGRRGEQPVSRHASTLATSTDISGDVKRRFRPDLKAGTPRRDPDEGSRR